MRVRDRDPRALAELFEYGFDRVYSLATRLLGDRTQAEDIAQEVFLKVYRAAPGLDPDRDPMPWLSAITHNACRDLWRSRSRRMEDRTTSMDATPRGEETVREGGADPEASVLDGERDRRVQDAIQRLPEDLRTVVLLRDYAGLSHEEIAGVVKSTHAAVRKRYSRALARLAGDLKELWDEHVG